MLHSEAEGVFEAVWNGVFIPHNKGNTYSRQNSRKNAVRKPTIRKGRLFST